MALKNGFKKCFKSIKVIKQLCWLRVSNNCTPFFRSTSAPFWVTMHDINTLHIDFSINQLCMENRLIWLYHIGVQHHTKLK